MSPRQPLVPTVAWQSRDTSIGRSRSVRSHSADISPGLVAEQKRGQRIGKDPRLGVNKQMSGPGGRGGHRGLARLAFIFHAGTLPANALIIGIRN